MADRAKPTLFGCKILVVEDEYLIAEEIAATLANSGAEIVGPAPDTARALSLCAAQSIEFAILDVNLRGEASFAVADALRAQGVPFMFLTGYSGSAIPNRFSDVPRRQKPFDHTCFAQSVDALMAR